MEITASHYIMKCVPNLIFLDRVDIFYFTLRYYSIFQFLWVILYWWF